MEILIRCVRASFLFFFLYTLIYLFQWLFSILLSLRRISHF